MKLGVKYTVYTVLAAVLLILTAAIFLFLGINPLVDQIDRQLSASFAPAPKLTPVLADDRPLVMTGFLAIIAVGISFAVIQLLLFRYQVLLPMRRMIDRTARLARGDFSVDLETPPEAPEEMVELGRSLRFIRDRMQSYVNRLQASRARETRAINRVEAFDHLKGDFLANVSLELKNPLSSILGFNRLIQRRIDGGKYDDELRRQCEIIAASARQLDGFIDKMLRLSRLDSGKYEPHRRELRTAELLQDVGEVSRAQAEARGIAVTCHYSPEQPDVVVSDRDVLLNGLSLFLTGVIKTSPAASEVSFGCTRAGAKIVFWIKAPAAENRSFSLAAMYQKNFLSASATRMAQLSGALMLNLAVAKSGFELLGAAVSVLGPDEQGSEFVIAFNAEDLLPAHGESSHQHTASNLSTARASARLKRSHEFRLQPESLLQRPLRAVLLAGDELTRQLLEQVLLQEGHRLESCGDAAAGLARLAAGPCDLLLIDLLPELAVLDLIKAVRLRPAEPRPYIIVTASHLDSAERQSLILAGADECWSKPLDVDVMFERFRQLGSGDIEAAGN